MKWLCLRKSMRVSGLLRKTLPSTQFLNSSYIHARTIQFRTTESTCAVKIDLV